MSQMLRTLYTFCQKTKHNSNKLIVSQYNHSKEVSEYSCDRIEFETSPYDSLNLVEDNGDRVLSFMIQDCVINFEGNSAKIYHLNKMYLEFDFIE